MEEHLLRHAGLPRPAPLRRRLCVVAVALRTRPTNLAVPGLPSAPTAPSLPLSAPEPVLPSSPVAADAAAVQLAAGVPVADLRHAAGCARSFYSCPWMPSPRRSGS
ncbi:unnamed protein product [Urochloa humidicola]